MNRESPKACRLMDRELDRQFGTDRWKLSDEVQQHLDGCEPCRRLWNRLLGQAGSTGFLSLTSYELQAKTKAAINSTLEPISPLPDLSTRVRLLLMLFAIGTLIGIVLRGPDGFHQMKALSRIANVIAAAIITSFLLLSLARQMTPGSLRWFAPGVTSASLAGFFLIGAALITPWGAGSEFVAQGWPCFRLGTLMAVPAALAYWRFVRYGNPLSLGRLGVTIGSIAGLLGGTVLQFTCTHQEANHLFVWHVGVVAGSAVLGFLIAETYCWFALKQA